MREGVTIEPPVVLLHVVDAVIAYNFEEERALYATIPVGP
jgi:hypothetical protein